MENPLNVGAFLADARFSSERRMGVRKERPYADQIDLRASVSLW